MDAKETRYIQQPIEIETVKSIIGNYVNGEWDAYQRIIQKALRSSLIHLKVSQLPAMEMQGEVN